MPRRLPAFARVIADARRKGLMPRRLGFGHVAVVLGWDNNATAGLHRIVIPPDDDLAKLDLSCLRGLHVFLSHRKTEAPRACAVVDALLADGVARVDCCNLDALDHGEPWERAWPVFEREVSYGA